MVDGVVRVLLVEDSDTQASLVASFLEHAPGMNEVFRTVRVADLAGALAQLRRDDRFDVVVLDLTLPDSHGAATLAAVGDATALPVVVMTAADDASGTGMLEAGASDYVHKDPMSLVALPRTLRYAVVRHAMSRDLASALSAREEADQRLRTFVSMASHELRSPISALRSLAALLEGRWEQLDDDQRRDLARRLDRRLGQIESVATLYLNAAAGQQEIHAALRPHDLGDVVAEAVRSCVPGPDRTDLHGAGRVWCDAGHVSAIVVNLVSNAVKYGGPPVTVRADGGTVVVSDAGDGVEDPDVLFTEWWREERSGLSSTGLGLALSKQLAIAGGAGLRYERDGGTTRFVLELPPAWPDEGPPATGPRPLAQSMPSAPSTRSPA